MRLLFRDRVQYNSTIGLHASWHFAWIDSDGICFSRLRMPYKVTGPERNVYMRQQALDSPRTLRRCAEYVSMEYNVSASVCVATRVCRVAPCLVRSERQASEPTASCCTFATLGSGPDHFRRRATCM